MRRLFPLKAVTAKNSNKFLIQRKVDRDGPFFCDYLKKNSSASSIFVAKDSEQNAGFLWQKQSKVCDGKGILALRISSEGESRKRDRSLKLIQGEMESRTKILENEKTDLQEALEKEIDRRSNEWACMLEKIRSEERRMRERVRDLAKQNVELQRELLSLNNREIHVKTQSEEEFEQVQQELKSETLLVKILQEKICSNEADLEQLEEEVATLVRNQDVLTSNIENLEGRLSSSNQKEKELELLLGGKENTIRCLQADLQECLKELALLRGEIPKISEERDDFQQDAERLKCQNMELISEVESLKMRVEKLQEDVLVREGQLSILQESLNA
ncbi:uncharacterized protein LOC131061426 isoform X2 [Cryptomeria japonica]|nr:uncharacterized protein LOC131061426 isoform X2 [Cryptomeria japonica]